MAPRGRAKIVWENKEIANHPWTASPRGRHRSLVFSQKTTKEGLMKLEEACLLEVTKRMDYGDGKEYPLTPKLEHTNTT